MYNYVTLFACKCRPQQWSAGFFALVEQFVLNAPSIQEVYDRQAAVNNLKQQTRLQNAEYHTAKREKEEVLRQLREAKALLQAALEDIRKAQDEVGAGIETRRGRLEQMMQYVVAPCYLELNSQSCRDNNAWIGSVKSWRQL